LAGGGTFTTPFMANDNIGGFSSGGSQVTQFPTRLYFNGVGPVNVTGISGTILGAPLASPGTYANMGIPGAKSFHLLAPGYGNPAGLAASPPTANPYFVRFASSTTTTVVADALAQDPTFFSLWIGGNDVLGYATNGGIPTSQDAATGNDITSPSTFNAVYNGIVAQLTAGGRKGVVANLPYVSTLPFFTTVPYNPLTKSSLGGGNEAVGLATINALNTQLYGPLKQALTAFGASDRINLLSTTAANPVLLLLLRIRRLAVNDVGQRDTVGIGAAEHGGQYARQHRHQNFNF